MWMRKALLALLFVAIPAGADDSWKFSLTPYLWLPTLNGNLNYQLPPDSGDGFFNVQIGPNDYLSNLKFALLLNGDMRKQRYSFASDVLYLNLGKQDSSVRTIDFAGDRLPVEAQINSNTTTGFKAMLWTVAGGYNLKTDESPMDVIAGVRYLGIDTHAEWQLTNAIVAPHSSRSFPSDGSTAKNVDLVDGILGVRGKAKVGARWYVPYYADIGAGSSKLTWQAMTGVTYAYGWGDVGLVYRHIAYQQKQPDLLKNLSLSGPGVTFTFHF
jgi:hypothetical protein